MAPVIDAAPMNASMEAIMHNEQIIIVNGPLNPIVEGVGKGLVKTYRVIETTAFDELIALLDRLTSNDDT